MLPTACRNEIELLCLPQADSPDVSKLPRDDIVGVTVILLTCSYENREFVRVGYYVNNEYVDPELKETPPPEPDFDKVRNAIFVKFYG